MQAIANAVANAFGDRVTAIPLPPWRVVKVAGKNKSLRAIRF